MGFWQTPEQSWRSPRKLIGTNYSCQFNFLSRARAVIYLIFIYLVSGRLGERTDKALNKENWLTKNGGLIAHHSQEGKRKVKWNCSLFTKSAPWPLPPSPPPPQQIHWSASWRMQKLPQRQADLDFHRSPCSPMRSKLLAQWPTLQWTELLKNHTEFWGDLGLSHRSPRPRSLVGTVLNSRLRSTGQAHPSALAISTSPWFRQKPLKIRNS